MMWRLKDLPVFSSAESKVEARYFNKIHLAQRRLTGPIRLQLKGLRNIDMFIDDDSWVCVDTSLNDLPVIAWTNFDVDGRDNLHEPIRCTLSYYHFGAAMLVQNALKVTEELLSQRLYAAPRQKSVPSKRRRAAVSDSNLFVVP